MVAAKLYNAMWKARRSGAGSEQDNKPKYPKGSIGEPWELHRCAPEWPKKPPRTCEEWDRVWARIEPVFADQKPKTIRSPQRRPFPRRGDATGGPDRQRR